MPLGSDVEAQLPAASSAVEADAAVIAARYTAPAPATAQGEADASAHPAGAVAASTEYAVYVFTTATSDCTAAVGALPSRLRLPRQPLAGVQYTIE
jgi:hypothetical protein